MEGTQSEPNREGLLAPESLYLGDNGRAFCGKLKCAGASAFYTKHDISGMRVERLTASQADAHGLKCEGCGMVPSRIIRANKNATARGRYAAYRSAGMVKTPYGWE